MTATRIYRVTVGENDRLIRAAHPSNALMFVARDLAKVRVASQADLVECLSDDIKIEDAKPEQTELPTT
jgi:hypothetical protein